MYTAVKPSLTGSLLCESSGELEGAAFAMRDSLGRFVPGFTHEPYNKSHGMTKTPTYKTWISMKARCFNPQDTGYHRYGARGITVCERWLVFEHFLADMGERPSGLTIDRISNDGNYEPDNCRWTTMKVQSNNRRDRPRLPTCAQGHEFNAENTGYRLDTDGYRNRYCKACNRIRAKRQKDRLREARAIA